MAEVHGVKETKEAALGLIYVAKEIVKAYRLADADGKIDFSDIGAFAGVIMNPEIAAKIKEASEGVDLVSAEMADLSLVEGIELVKDVGLAALEAVKEVKA